uniref:Uncharacterized protein n=1 Tax=Oryza rufipogon TaxID=4529 RepID=A0A0E0NEY8_ORYRU
MTPRRVQRDGDPRAVPRVRPVFSYLISKTHVDRDINSRNTVTVLVDNSAAAAGGARRAPLRPRRARLHRRREDRRAAAGEAHRVDNPIAALPRGRPTVSTTLFQTTGNVCRRTRFLAITPTAKGGAVFTSAALSALVNATLKRVVAAVPYNIFQLRRAAECTHEATAGAPTVTAAPER